MIDSHCHLDIAAFDLDRAAVVARAQAAGVIGMLVPAIRPATWPTLGTLAGRYEGAGWRTAFGIHPQIVPSLEIGEFALTTSVDAFCQALVGADRAAQSQGAAPMVAVGECGLDGGTAMFELQEQLFRLQLRVARQLKLPVVVHVLRAHHRAPAIMREECIDTVGGIMHSYSGGTDLLGVYRDLGMAFSFAGPVTFPGSRRPLGAAMQVPLDLLLVETDAPDQAPMPHRGSRSERPMSSIPWPRSPPLEISMLRNSQRSPLQPPFGSYRLGVAKNIVLRLGNHVSPVRAASQSPRGCQAVFQRESALTRQQLGD